jgi:hypothetical protein
MDRIRLLCTDIGRGHPFYLDGLRSHLASAELPNLLLESHRVTDLCSAAGGLAWRGIRFLYERGSSPGLWSAFYNRLREESDYNRDRPALKLLQASWDRRVRDHPAGPIVVSHHLLVAALRPHPLIWYQHGESVVPSEAVVRGAFRVLVPTEETASRFAGKFYRSDQVLVTGLCIEPELVAQADRAYRHRLERFSRAAPLTGAFFSSGAEPAQHVRTLAVAARSVVASGGRAFVVARRGGRLEAAVRHACTSFGELPARQPTEGPGDPPSLVLVSFNSRGDLDRLTAAYYGQFDYCLAPAHERTNWALGLGLPLFIVGPDIGPFAPLNRALLLGRGVAMALEETGGALGKTLDRLRGDGSLAEMATRGHGAYPIHGFSQAVRLLLAELS